MLTHVRIRTLRISGNCRACIIKSRCVKAEKCDKANRAPNGSEAERLAVHHIPVAFRYPPLKLRLLLASGNNELRA